MSKVRTRFAPSPTGRMHVGNLRTALYAYLIAKHEGGDFLLRIEDTDQERYVEGAVDIIYHTLAETGLIHDEGPDKDGGCGPYVQSERQAAGCKSRLRTDQKFLLIAFFFQDLSKRRNSRKKGLIHIIIIAGQRDGKRDPTGLCYHGSHRPAAVRHLGHPVTFRL